MTEKKSPESPDLGDPEVRKAVLNTETAKIPWRDMQRYFAAGSAIYVSRDLDLLDVGGEVMADNKDRIQHWLGERLLGPVSDRQAAEWHEADAMMWAVVLSPWVLVQPVK